MNIAFSDHRTLKITHSCHDRDWLYMKMSRQQHDVEIHLFKEFLNEVAV